MILLCKNTICFFDCCIICIFAYAKHFVVISFLFHLFHLLWNLVHSVFLSADFLYIKKERLRICILSCPSVVISIVNGSCDPLIFLWFCSLDFTVLSAQFKFRRTPGSRPPLVLCSSFCMFMRWRCILLLLLLVLLLFSESRVSGHRLQILL